MEAGVVDNQKSVNCCWKDTNQMLASAMKCMSIIQN